jgi:peroxiredoxin
MTALSIGEQAKPFRLPGTDDQEYSLSSFEDRNLLAVIFSCNHCPYVQAWESRMVQIQADYKEKGVQFVAINANDASKYPDDNFESMKARVLEKGFNFPYLRDKTQEVAREYGAERTPEVFLFDADRKLIYHGTIDDNYDDPQAVESTYLRDAIEAGLAGRTPELQTTTPVGCTIKWK